MDFRVTLYHPVVGTFVTSSPDGWKTAAINRDRHPDFHCLVKSYKTNFSLYGTNGIDDGGRDFFKAVANIGVDEEIQVTNELRKDDFSLWVTVFKGLLPIVAAIEILDIDHAIQVTFTPSSLWAKFINRYDTPVNILDPNDLDGNARTVLTPFKVKLPAQILNRVTEYTGHSGDATTAEDCFVASTAPLGLTGFPIVDGVQTVDFMRVLYKDDSDPKKNGLYNAASGAWTRTSDANSDVEIENLIVSITNGTTNGGKSFRQTTTPITIGVSNIVFVSTNLVDNTLMANFGYTSDLSSIQLVLPARFQQFTAIKKLDEITNSFQYDTNFIGSDYSTPGHTVPDPVIGNVLELIDEFGTIVFNYSLDLWWSIFGTWNHISSHNAVPSKFRIQTAIFYQINQDTPFELDFGFVDYNTGLVSGNPGGTISSGPLTFSIAGTFTLPKINRGDLVSVYLKHSMFVYKDGIASEQFQFTNLKPRGGFIASDNKFNFASLTPDSESDALYVHDVVSSAIDRIVGGDGSLYSPVLGNIYSQSKTYLANGNASMYVPLQGLQIRGWALVDKIMSLSVKSCWDGLNPAFNLGLAAEVVDDVEVLVIKPKIELYDTSSMTILLSNVTKIKKTYDQGSLINKIEIGNEKWEQPSKNGGGISGLDDVQTKRTLATIFKFVGSTLTLYSKWIFAGLTLELTRRSFVTKNDSYTYDNDIFLLAVKNSGGVVSPQLDENFSSVTGLQNEGSRYNKILTPYRALLRNLNLIVGGLQDYSSSVIKFLSGEGNYDMASTTISTTNPEDFGGANLAENQDIPVSGDFLHRAELYEIDHIITSEDWQKHDAEPHKAIGVSLSETGHKEFLIKSINYTIFDGRLNVIGWFKEKFDIEVVQTDNNSKIFGKDFDDTYN
jgi:hypothetical protein